MRKYAYARVSSIDQNEDRQMIEIRKLGITDEFIYVDKQSGKDFERPMYRKMVSNLKKGDVVYILSIDRLGRNYQEIQNQWRIITQDIGADICVIDMPLLDTRKDKDLLGTFIADLVLQVLSFVAESHRLSIKESQRQGIEAAELRGVRFGRPRKTESDNFEDLINAWRTGELMIQDAVKKCGFSEATFYRRLKELSRETEEK